MSLSVLRFLVTIEMFVSACVCVCVHVHVSFNVNVYVFGHFYVSVSAFISV